MKKYGCLLVLLIIQVNSFFEVKAVSRFRASAVGQKIDEVQVSAQKLLSELQGLKKCRAARSCTKAQYDRIKDLGKKIGAVTIVLVGAGILTGLGVRSRMKPTVENAVRAMEVDLQDPRTGAKDRELLEAFASNDMGSITTIYKEADAKIGDYSLGGIRGSGWLALQNKNKQAYAYAQLLNDLKTGIRKK